MRDGSWPLSLTGPVAVNEIVQVVLARDLVAVGAAAREHVGVVALVAGEAAGLVDVRDGVRRHGPGLVGDAGTAVEGQRRRRSSSSIADASAVTVTVSPSRVSESCWPPAALGRARTTLAAPVRPSLPAGRARLDPAQAEVELAPRAPPPSPATSGPIAPARRRRSRNSPGRRPGCRCSSRRPAPGTRASPARPAPGSAAVASPTKASAPQPVSRRRRRSAARRPGPPTRCPYSRLGAGLGDGDRRARRPPGPERLAREPADADQRCAPARDAPRRRQPTQNASAAGDRRASVSSGSFDEVELPDDERCATTRSGAAEPGALVASRSPGRSARRRGARGESWFHCTTASRSYATR